MLRKVITCTVLSLITAAMAYAEINPYVSLSGGMSLLRDTEISGGGMKLADVSYDNGYILEMAAGAQFGMDIDTIIPRVELALSYQSNEADEMVDYTSGTVSQVTDSQASATALMLNGYLDFPLQYGITPYVMAGIGGAHVDLEIDRAEVLAGQIGCGVGYSLTQNLILDLKYKYFQTEDVDIQSGLGKGTVAGHHLMAGLRYQF